jgi:hypothetical protein
MLASFAMRRLPLVINKSKFNHMSNIKSSSATSALSNSRTNSESTTSGVETGRDLADIVAFFVAMAGGRKDTDVAGRAGRRDVVETVAVHGVEVMRPVAVAGRAGAVLSDNFFDGPVGRVGSIRIACTRLEGT